LHFFSNELFFACNLQQSSTNNSSLIAVKMHNTFFFWNVTPYVALGWNLPPFTLGSILTFQYNTLPVKDKISPNSI
jgi:hypothetical protein